MTAAFSKSQISKLKIHFSDVTYFFKLIVWSALTVSMDASSCIYIFTLKEKVMYNIFGYIVIYFNA